MVRTDVSRLLDRLTRGTDQIAVEVLPAGSMTDDICEILSDRKFPELQAVVRDNLYSKTVPYTTRPAREGEIDGEHYRFVSVEEFKELQQNGQLLEHGIHNGHFYGSRRPEECYADGEQAMVSHGTTEGLLPANWETAYTENGDKYFIDHNTGTTTWDDPRDLPVGWEQVDDPVYGTFYVDHVNKKTQYDRPMTTMSSAAMSSRYDTLPTTTNSYSFNHNSYNELTTLKSSPRDSGFDSSPTRYSRRFGNTLTNGGGNANMAPMKSRGSNPMFTTDPSRLGGELISTRIIKGPKGLGFTLIGNDASSKGDEFIQVKSVLTGGPAAANGILRSGDILVRVNGALLLGAKQKEACDVFVAIPVGDPVDIQICRGYELFIDPSNRIVTENVYSSTSNRSRDLHDIDIFKGSEGFGFTIADSVNGQRVKKILYPSQCPNLMEGDTIVELDGRNVRAVPHTQLVDILRECPVGYRGRLVVRRGSPKSRSRTPTAAFRYGEGDRTTPAMNGSATTTRSKTPAPTQKTSNDFGTISRSGISNYESQDGQARNVLQRQPAVNDTWEVPTRMRPSSTTLGFATPNYIPISTFREKPSDLITVSLIRKPVGFGFRLLGGTESNTPLSVGQIVAGGAAEEDGRLREGDEILEIDGKRVEGASHAEAVALLETAAHNKHVKMIVRRPRNEFRRTSLPTIERKGQYEVVLDRAQQDGFGFVLMATQRKNGSTIGHIQPGSPAARCGQLNVGDRVVAVNGIDILNLSHSEIILLIKDSGLSVRLTIGAPDNSSSSTLGRTNPLPQYSNSNGYDSRDYGVVPPPPPNLNLNSYSTLNTTVASRSTYMPYERLTNLDMEGLGVSDKQSSQNGVLIDVSLERGTRGFGFSIRGGQEFGAMPLFVLRIADDGPAKLDGRLQVGDQLITINGNDTTGMSHDEAIKLIKQHVVVKLTVLRNKLP
ncbi:unnamed protein product [Caenorhabditis auriculariae]|uniref:Uncharacterized protein n=1 Tax=Caenorhabditis auriculariae TaxID=2777116 RepID=A0A8S1HL74_9PELO|nr:unnamed protein product [Caenorhabditis auriculariae]